MPTGYAYTSQIEQYLATTIRKTKYACKKIHGREFSLSLSDVIEMVKKQNGKCALTGWELEFTRGGEWYGEKNPRGCTMDRIRNDRGYTVDNVQLVCAMPNVMRGSLPLDEFVSMCKSISQVNQRLITS